MAVRAKAVPTEAVPTKAMQVTAVQVTAVQVTAVPTKAVPTNAMQVTAVPGAGPVPRPAARRRLIQPSAGQASSRRCWPRRWPDPGRRSS
jgi:hypothetical protein